MKKRIPFLILIAILCIGGIVLLIKHFGKSEGKQSGIQNEVTTESNTGTEESESAQIQDTGEYELESSEKSARNTETVQTESMGKQPTAETVETSSDGETETKESQGDPTGEPAADIPAPTSPEPDNEAEIPSDWLE